MFRLMGFISGVAIAMFVLAILVDAPISSGFRELTDQLWQRGAALPNEIKPDQETLMPSREQADVAPGTSHAVDRNAVPSRQAPMQTEIATTPSPPETEGTSDFETQTSASITMWHAVWKPFRSRLAASGFADRLARLTNREYRVRRLAVGAYQVEVGYNPDLGVAETLMQIRVMTGLRIRELQP